VESRGSRTEREEISFTPMNSPPHFPKPSAVFAAAIACITGFLLPRKNAREAYVLNLALRRLSDFPARRFELASAIVRGQRING
jgi:hypothetical protein